MKKIFGSLELAKIVHDVPLTCLDIGARKGIIEDLLPFAAGINAYGFEPDTDECKRLTALAKTGKHPWRKLTYLPVALGKAGGPRLLNIYRHRGGSSLLEADLDLLKQYSRSKNFELIKQIEVRTVPLDDAAKQYGCEHADYLKIDVQGTELEILASAPRLLEHSILALRCEVEFIPNYKDQPLFHEIDAHLRARGFLPMGFIQIRYWRRTTRRRLTFNGGPMLFSRGQIAHTDVVYLRDPARMADDTDDGIRSHLKAACLALTYGCVDHAAALLERARVAEFVRDTYGIDQQRMLSKVSKTLARRHRRAQYGRALKGLGEALAQSVCNLVGRPMHVAGPWTR